MTNILIILLVIFIFISSLFIFWKSFKTKVDLDKRDKKMRRQMYELAILKELGERIGYSLDVQKIIDIITGSLNQFIEYNAVSYMLLEPEKVLFKIHLEKSVSRKFVDEVRDRMIKSLSALLDKEIPKDQIEETLSGAILVEELNEPVGSFFNIPLVIGDKLVGILTVAHTKVGLYKEEEMTILYKLTKQASQAVTRLQEVVRTEQRKLNAMVESMNEGVVMTDTDYRVMVVNPAAKKLLGLENKENLTIFDFIDNLEGKFDIRGKLEESVKLDKILAVNDVMIGDRFLQIFISPVKGSIGLTKDKIQGGVVIFHDKTREKEVEKMREDFTSMMVHELRSPLDGIKKITEFMNTNGNKSEEKINTENINMIHNASSDMLELVNDLLDVAKLEAGKFQVYKDPVDIKQIIEKRVSFYNVSAKELGLSIKTYFDPQLPSKIDFDLMRISQVLNNFISNALKFTKTGGEIAIQAFLHKKDGDINIEGAKLGAKWFTDKNIDLSTIGDALVVSVSDNGIGIASEDLANLFNKFKQFRTSSVHKGTGLGLAITKGIVEAHGGVVGVGSEEGVGSTFYFVLPIS